MPAFQWGHGHPYTVAEGIGSVRVIHMCLYGSQCESVKHDAIVTHEHRLINNQVFVYIVMLQIRKSLYRIYSPTNRYNNCNCSSWLFYGEPFCRGGGIPTHNLRWYITRYSESRYNHDTYRSRPEVIYMCECVSVFFFYVCVHVVVLPGRWNGWIWLSWLQCLERKLSPWIN